ncbi:ABC transporter related protein [Thermodesulfatator indicus DSM 15286]|uniref:ABC transporter related protein n=1 Tax=Thermodesulfatator indicus (strain DSM 15286 / JCM 11887 / CIR29812) TaxID=667014 RepID=F8ADQ0_THEID|nr:ABC transporter ATP-binding protein [Thermodesulfatator indicus]AEH46008.1 ABC transporter related protein [Thermodesulfatator indicus DSM 15286]
MNILRIENVSKSFGEVKVLEDINISIKEGEFFSILGPSGSGKTTILRLIAGFLIPNEGTIKINNKIINNLPPEKREVNIVFQSLALFPMMNVYENVAFGLKMKKLPKKEIREKVLKMLEKVGLKGFENRKISELSGGQKQRVAIARSLIMKPKILLLDEPLSALDKKLKEHMMIELKLLQKEFKTTFIYITHDQSEAMVMSDRIAVINEGKIEQIDKPFNLYNYPKTHFVASFIGENNRFKVKAFNNGTLITESGMKIPVNSIKNENIKEIFIRPESFILNPDKNEFTFTGIVETVLFDGPQTKLLVKSEYNDDLLITVKERSQIPKAGEKIKLGIKLDEVRVF